VHAGHPANATPAERQAALAQSQTCGGGGDAFGGISRIFASPYTLSLGLTGSLTVFSGGRVQAANQVAAAGRRVAEIGITAARAQLHLDVAQAYYNAVLADRLVQISESTYVQSERTLRQTSIAQQVGNIAEFDLLRARVTRDNQRPVMIQARTQRDVAYLQLRQLLNLPARAPITLTTELPMPESAAPATMRTAEVAAPSAAAPNAAAPGASRTLTPVAQVTSAPLTFDPREVLAEDPRVAAAIDSVVATADTVARDRASARQALENVSCSATCSGRRARSGCRPSRCRRRTSASRIRAAARCRCRAAGTSSTRTGRRRSRCRCRCSRAVGSAATSSWRRRAARGGAAGAPGRGALGARRAGRDRAARAGRGGVAGERGDGRAGEPRVPDLRGAVREGISTLVETADARLMLQQAQWNAVTAARDLQIARAAARAAEGPAVRRGAERGAQGGQQAPGAPAGGARAGGASAGAGAGAAGQRPTSSPRRARAASRQPARPAGAIHDDEHQHVSAARPGVRTIRGRARVGPARRRRAGRVQAGRGGGRLRVGGVRGGGAGGDRRPENVAVVAMDSIQSGPAISGVARAGEAGDDPRRGERAR
jgi:outer membrane protein TolC